jgi:Cu-Zn family superoxide dismutase
MKVSSKAVLALLFVPGALSSLRGSNEDKVEAQRKLWGLTNLLPCLLGRELEATLRNPSATNPNDCDTEVCGTVTFSCPDLTFDSSHNGLTKINYRITGLSAGLHGLHVHENAVDGDCASTNGHWNPEAQNHGSNLDAQRHIGDLGNVLAVADGNGTLAEGELLANVPLRGRLGIEGLAVVVHAGADDLGTGGDNGSRAVGNAGARPACGTINQK